MSANFKISQVNEKKNVEPEAYDKLNCYKLCNQNVCRLLPDGKVEIVYTIQGDILYSKLVQVSETHIYLVGGASDIQFRNTLNSLYLLDLSSSPLRLEEKAKMRTPR